MSFLGKQPDVSKSIFPDITTDISGSNYPQGIVVTASISAGVTCSVGSVTYLSKDSPAPGSALPQVLALTIADYCLIAQGPRHDTLAEKTVVQFFLYRGGCVPQR